MISPNRDRVVTNVEKSRASELKPSLLAIVTGGLVAKECKSIDFSKEVYDFLAKVVILVWRSDIFVVKECKSIAFSNPF